MRHARLPAVLLASALVATPGPAASADPVADRLEMMSRREGSIPLIVRLDVPFRPEPSLTAFGRTEQRQEIDQERGQVLDELAGTGSELVRTFQSVPFVVLQVTPEGLDELRDSPNVTRIQEDVLLEPNLAQSTSLIQATDVRMAGYTGIGQTVAVLDSGIDASHPFLAGKVVEEACYSMLGGCPGGKSASVGPGTGAPCSIPPDCKHGTHVAGIVAGLGTSFSGVASGARLMSVQVFSRVSDPAQCAGPVPCARAFTSDVLKGLERVYALRSQYAFAAVNLSVGAGGYRAYCDSNPLKPAIDNLRAAGIASVVASGNDGFSDAVAAPSCISSAVSVGATTDTGVEAVAPFSNSAPFLTLLAPGSVISSSVPGGTFDSFVGTSMAAPHVAGAFAVLRQKQPGTSVDDVVRTLQSSGRSLSDPRTGIAKTSIRLYAAAFGQGPPVAATLSLHLRKHLVATGRLSPAFPGCGQPVTVAIQRRKGGWHMARTVEAEQSGDYRVKLPDRSGRYRAVATGTSPQGSCSAVSPARTYRA